MNGRVRTFGDFRAFGRLTGLTHGDAVILRAGEGADVGLLLSGDMQQGFTYKGITIVNPFSKTQHPLLQALLNPGKP